MHINMDTIETQFNIEFILINSAFVLLFAILNKLARVLTQVEGVTFLLVGLVKQSVP